MVQLELISDHYVLNQNYLTMIVRRGGGGGARAPADETAVSCARVDDFDWAMPERVPDMLVSVCATKECLSVNEVLPDVLPDVSTGMTAVPVSMAIVDEMVSSAVLVEGATLVVVSLADEEIFSVVGMVGLIEAGRELPADLLVSECVLQDCPVVDVGMVIPEQSPIMYVREAAVPMPFPAVDEVFFPAVFAGLLLLMQPLWPLWGQSLLVCLS